MNDQISPLSSRQVKKRRQRAADPERYREKRIASRMRSRRRQREAVFDHYGRSCACCAATGPLTIDHVKGDGAKHRREVLRNQGSDRLYHWLCVNGFPDGFQTMCEPCNGSKANKRACRIDHESREADVA